jgi:hypothetical protein
MYMQIAVYISYMYNLSFEFWQTGDRSIQNIVRSSTAHIYIYIYVCIYRLCTYKISVTFNVSLPCDVAGLVNIHMYRLPSWSENRRVASTRWGIVDRNLYR